MQLVSRKNTMLALAALLVVGLGYMNVKLANKPKKSKVQGQSVEQVQKMDTEQESDLQEVENELEHVYQ